MIRCPECGQALSFRANIKHIKENYKEPLPICVVAVYPGIISDEAHVKAQLASASVRQPMWIDFEDLMALPDTEISLTCVGCGFREDVSEFINAFDFPSDYELEENMCYCGEELYLENIPGTTKMNFICDSCGWVNPKGSVFGG